MNQTPTPLFETDNGERLPLRLFTEQAYLEYAMYVILDRALPHIGDGLKPVQRRIVYAMSELGLNATAKYKKSARTVGDVLGKFHPHGDSACYEAMVLMAQPFSYRYPLVDGQGNWGAPDDPKSFAAMRYTEARLSKYAELLLGELEQGTVNWVPNFDGTLKEPEILPARLPNVLLNGATGIAVGMATDIPPHNLREVANACILLLKKPKAGLDELMVHIKGPDYPTSAEIISPPEELRELYRTGTGSIRMRATYHRENGDIIVDALPHQVSGAKVIEQIATQMQAKKLPLVTDVRDESDHEDPTRIVIVPRSGRMDVETLMAHLFATTDLERTYRVNLNMIGLDGRPGVRGLKELLTEWLEFRTQTVRKRLSHRLEKVNDRLHVLEGLLVAFLNIDEVIEIIRSEDHPKPVLMERFGLSARQAEAILELKLRHLAKLEEIRIRGELDELSKERDYLNKTLGSSTRLKTLIRKELEKDAKTYGDDRKSPIVNRKMAQAIDETEMVPVEPITVILSEKGWVRAAKGHDIDPDRLNFRSGDRFKMAATGRTNQSVVFLDSTGRTYSVAPVTLPSARSHGEPLSGRVNLPPSASIEAVLMGPPEKKLFMASDFGYGFITQLKDLYTKNRAGKAVLTLPAGARPLPPIEIADPDTLLLATFTSDGRFLIFPINKLPVLAKGKGNKIIHIPPDRLKSGLEKVVQLSVFAPESQLIIYSGKRTLTFKYENLRLFMAERGRRGKLLPRGFRKVDNLKVIPPDTGTNKNESGGD